MIYDAIRVWSAQLKFLINFGASDKQTLEFVGKCRPDGKRMGIFVRRLVCPAISDEFQRVLVRWASKDRELHSNRIAISIAVIVPG